MMDKYLSEKGKELFASVKIPRGARRYRSRLLDGWYITCVMRRYDGVFAFIRKDEGNKIFVRYIGL